jgi:hypothetical protein
MKDPQISWYVLEDEVLTPYEEYYAGSYRPNDTFEITMYVWNNRWGQEVAKDVQQGTIAVYFDTIEDAYLLNLCSISIDDSDFKSLTITSNRGRVGLGRVLFGETNVGSSSAKNNYAKIILKFGPITDGIRNSLKNLYVDLEFDN